MTRPILIVGAGPTGLTLACELARRRVPFRLIDAREQPANSGRGKGVQPRTLELMHPLGARDALLAAGGPYPAFRAWNGAVALGDRVVFPQREPTPDVPFPNLWMVPQWRTEQILRDRLAELDGRVEHGNPLLGFHEADDGIRATLGSGEVHAAFLIGADGGRSFVRRTLDVGFEGETWETHRMWVGDVAIDGLDREFWHVWPQAEGGMVSLCPLAGTDTFQLTMVAGDETAVDPERLQALFDARTGRSDLALRVVSEPSLYRANVRMVDRFRVGRVFLAGDAAHVHSPAGGQGLNTGVQDAVNLGWKLAAVVAGAPEALLDTYEDERLPVAAEVLRISSRLHHQAVASSTPGDRTPTDTDQLGIHYRWSPLASDHRTSPGVLRAGDRAPDAPCEDGHGVPIRLSDVLRDPRPTLLVFGPGPDVSRFDTVQVRIVTRPGEVAERALVDVGGSIRSAYDVADGTWIVVRPDGYVGLITDRGPDDVAAWLRQVTRPTPAGGRCP